MTKQPVPGLHENFAEAAAMSTDKAPDYSSHRGTFTVPPGHEAVRDGNGRATGEVRPIAALAQAEQPVADIDALAAAFQDGFTNGNAEWSATPSYHQDMFRAGVRCLLAALAHPPAKREAGETPAPQSHLRGIVAAFEAAYPELYYHIAKGKICAGEPLYGAIITTMGTTEIGHGESDISADDALRIAIENAGLTIPPPSPRERVSDTPSAALAFDDEVIAYAQEIVDDREANGCKVYVVDVIDALRAALEASHE